MKKNTKSFNEKSLSIISEVKDLNQTRCKAKVQAVRIARKNYSKLVRCLPRKASVSMKRIYLIWPVSTSEQKQPAKETIKHMVLLLQWCGYEVVNDVVPYEGNATISGVRDKLDYHLAKALKLDSILVAFSLDRFVRASLDAKVKNVQGEIEYRRLKQVLNGQVIYTIVSPKVLDARSGEIRIAQHFKDKKGGRPPKQDLPHKAIHDYLAKLSPAQRKQSKRAIAYFLAITRWGEEKHTKFIADVLNMSTRGVQKLLKLIGANFSPEMKCNRD